MSDYGEKKVFTEVKGKFPKKSNLIKQRNEWKQLSYFRHGTWYRLFQGGECNIISSKIFPICL